jgi:hypothetical protein
MENGINLSEINICGESFLKYERLDEERGTKQAQFWVEQVLSSEEKVSSQQVGANGFTTKFMFPKKIRFTFLD